MPKIADLQFTLTKLPLHAISQLNLDIKPQISLCTFHFRAMFLERTCLFINFWKKNYQIKFELKNIH